MNRGKPPEECWLEEQGKALRGAPVPEGRLDEAIRSGIRRASAESRERRRFGRAGWSAAAAVVTVLCIAGSIRLSPAFAEAVGRLPGMESIVELIRYDRGLTEAVRNDYYQAIGAYETHGEVTFAVDGVIPDEKRLLIFYTIRDASGVVGARLHEATLRLPDGSIASGYSMSYRGSWDGEAAPAYSDVAELLFTEEADVPAEFTLEVRLATMGLPSDDVWRVPIRIDLAQRPAAEYRIDRKVDIEGQRVTFSKAIVYPTRIAVELEYDPNNTKEIFSFLDLALIGDGGERFAERSSFLETGLRRTVYFEGSSFSIPESLTLTGSAARAIDKERTHLVVDTGRKRVLEAPDDRISLTSVTDLGDSLELCFELRGVAADDFMIYSVVESEFEDAQGRSYRTGSGQRSARPGDDRQSFALEIPDEAYEQPLRFEIYNYPGYIREPFEIRIR
ncbi:DUF4179 domain-containing protein [Paenibacillus sp.]|uniref:DUF4179 domain-containing protein n=1 Tax=Paenibacillus sp. TaxID=58172 RepID=UPI002D4BF130|nr:DUF4179 domain-containing protein [Paenibacillus sp.]HZG83912.1 DUF4179 domain-containing protein [Paenibacillus sp.]